MQSRYRKLFIPSRMAWRQIEVNCSSWCLSWPRQLSELFECIGLATAETEVDIISWLRRRLHLNFLAGFLDLNFLAGFENFKTFAFLSVLAYPLSSKLLLPTYGIISSEQRSSKGDPAANTIGKGVNFKNGNTLSHVLSVFDGQVGLVVWHVKSTVVDDSPIAVFKSADLLVERSSPVSNHSVDDHSSTRTSWVLSVIVVALNCFRSLLMLCS